MLQPPTQPLVVDGAGMPGNGVTERSRQLRHCQTERTGDCRLQHETDRGCVFLTAPVRNNYQKHSQKPFSARFNTALEASLQAWQQQKHHAVIPVSPAVVQGAPDITREIQQDIARRMESGTMRCRGLIALLMGGRAWPPPILAPGRSVAGKRSRTCVMIMQRLTALEQSGEMGRKMDAFKGAGDPQQSVAPCRARYRTHGEIQQPVV